MLTAQRQLIIQKALLNRQFISVHEASDLTLASEATTRRDFAQMEQAGFLRRIRGGAAAVQSDSSLSLDARKEIMGDEKNAIAQAAAAFCEENDTVMIDGGSTTQAMIAYLHRIRLSVITNSFEIARELLAGRTSRLYLLGGEVDQESGIIRSSFQADSLGNYRAETVFMGVGGIDANGATNDDDQLIRVERAMIDQASRVIVLADSSKFIKRGKLFLCTLREIDIVITDTGISAQQKNMLEQAGINVVVCA